MWQDWATFVRNFVHLNHSIIDQLSVCSKLFEKHHCLSKHWCAYFWRQLLEKRLLSRRRWTTGSAQYSSMYRIVPNKCCIFFSTCCTNNSLPLVPIQPSSPFTKDLRGLPFIPPPSPSPPSSVRTAWKWIFNSEDVSELVGALCKFLGRGRGGPEDESNSNENLFPFFLWKKPDSRRRRHLSFKEMLIHLYDLMPKELCRLGKSRPDQMYAIQVGRRSTTFL